MNSSPFALSSSHPFTLSLSKGLARPFALSLSKGRAHPFTLSLSKGRAHPFTLCAESFDLPSVLSLSQGRPNGAAKRSAR
jgi:hypothetical protein